MGRLVFAGVFDRWPELVVITHHTGGIIPMMEGRLGGGLDCLGIRTPDDHGDAIKTALKQRPVDAFRCFYADTATFGAKPPIDCGLAFFGTERLLFATDMPFGPEEGLSNVRSTLAAIHAMDVTPHQRRQILGGNAERVLALSRP